ncbi:MAG: hypothetical protein ACKOH8_08860, partial [Gemmatimonadota bacterium]
MRLHCVLRTIPFALIGLASACGTPPAAPDRLFVNARIWTGDATRPEATAIAIRHDSIIAIGTDDSLRT